MSLSLFRRTTASGEVFSGFGRPFGVGEDLAGRLLVTDMDCHMLVRFSADFESYQYHDGVSGWSAARRLDDGQSVERPRLNPKGMNGPHSVAETGNGELIVICYYEPLLALIHSDGSMSRLVHGRGVLAGPATARLGRSGQILVAEYAQNLVLVFDLLGNYLGRIGRSDDEELLMVEPHSGGVSRKNAVGGLDRPHMAIQMRDDSILVADTWNHRLQRFTLSERSVCELKIDSDGIRAGLGVAALPPCPVAIDEDVAGRILVTDWANSQILLMNQCAGNVVRVPVPGLNQPYDARFYRQGLVVADSGAGRVLLMNDLCECE